MDYFGAREIKNGIILLDDLISPIAYDEIVEIIIKNKPKRTGRVIEINEDKAAVLVFEGTSGLSTKSLVSQLSGKFMEISLSEEILGRVFNGLGTPIDGLGEIFKKVKRNINGNYIFPTQRIYPRNYIETGVSAIDSLLTLIRGQKLPIFSTDELPHDVLAAQIASHVANKSHEKFAVVFAAMGLSFDTSEFFRNSFIESGGFLNTVMFLNLNSDPIVERIATPRFALTAAEYLAYDLGYQVLVILTDMTSYCEALREISSARGEVPGRKGYPGYMYSDLASIYERAGIIKGSKGSITQIPILTMPSEDITHPIPDLTGYITEGQIVLDKTLYKKGIYPPINVLPSLSRLMKDGIGEGFTTKEHPHIAAKLFAAYAEVMELRSLISVVGEDDLTENDKKLLEFGKTFEQQFLNQNEFNSRNIDDTLSLASKLKEMIE